MSIDRIQSEYKSDYIPNTLLTGETVKPNTKAITNRIQTEYKANTP